MALEQSRCDRFAVSQFEHAADGIYMQNGRLEEVRAWLRGFEISRGGDDLVEAQENEVDHHVHGIWDEEMQPVDYNE